MTRTHHHRRFHLPKPNAANEGPEGWLQYGRKVQVTRCLTDCPIILQPKQQDGHAHNWLLCFMTIFIVVVTSLYLPCGRTTLLSVFHIRLFA